MSRKYFKELDLLVGYGLTFAEVVEILKNNKRRGENKNAERRGRPGYEFWSRRPYFGEGKLGKMLTHRAERRAAKREARREL